MKTLSGTKRSSPAIPLALVACAVTACLLLYFRASRAQTSARILSADTPIKVAGGSMTVHSKSSWNPAGKSATYYTCIAKSPTTYYAVALNDPGDQKAIPVTGRWTVQTFDYQPNASLTAGQEGMKLSILDASQCDNDQMKEKLQISTFGGSSDFYENPGPADAAFNHNRRFENPTPSNPNCGADRDLCERLSSYIVTNPGSPGIPIDCTKKICALYLVSNVPVPSGQSVQH